MGPAVRATADAGQAQALAQLGAHIAPGYVLRLERLRPQWCDGWVGDVVVETSNMGEVYEFVRSEFGGQHYRVVVLGAQETPVYEGRLSIAAPPRAEGRPINRDAWENALAGRTAAPERDPNPRTVVERSGGSDGSAGLIKMLFDQQRETSNATLDAVKEMMGGVREMVTSVLQQREDSATRGSFASQLGEMVDNTRALQKVGKLFGAAAPKDGGSDADDPLVDEAKRMFLHSAMGSMFRPPAGNGHPRQAPVITRQPNDIPAATKK